MKQRRRPDPERRAILDVNRIQRIDPRQRAAQGQSGRGQPYVWGAAASPILLCVTTDCPKCGYARQACDSGPLTECPKCGIVFFKYAEAMAKKAAAAAEPKPGPTVASRMKAASEAFEASQHERRKAESLICKSCGAFNPVGKLPGSGWVEAALWLVFLWPIALVYSIWRRSTRKRACSECGSRELVGVATPVGASLVATHFPEGLPPIRR